MEPICLFFTVCGAATLSAGVMKIVEKLEK
jgi:hypothetical protein